MTVVKRDELLLLTEKLLRKRFTRFEGWELKKSAKDGPDLLFELNYHDKIQRVLCDTVTGKVDDSIANNLKRKADVLSSPGTKIFRMIAAVPQGTKISTDMRKRLEKDRIEILTVPTGG